MTRVRLGELLVQEGKIDQAQLQSALAYQRRWGKKIGDSLVHLGFITELDLCQTLSKALRIPIIDVTKIDPLKITKEILNHISVQLARMDRIIPIAIKEVRSKKRLVVATSDPTNYKLFDDLQFKSNLPVLVMIAPDSDIDWFIRKYYLSEAEALPLNYVSGISIIDGDVTDGEALPDPISNIFSDSEFTGMTGLKYTNAGKTQPGLKTDPGSRPTSPIDVKTDSKKDKK